MIQIPLNHNTDQIKNKLPQIKELLHKAKRCIVVAGTVLLFRNIMIVEYRGTLTQISFYFSKGAGISVSSGIPDFRSPDGLFALLKKKYPKARLSGQDLFDATLFHVIVSDYQLYLLLVVSEANQNITISHPAYCLY